MMRYERELNPEQLRVVIEGDGPVLVIAGAGSGKTRTLTYRVAHLIESGVSPDRILLATFTNKAARTMLSRVKSLTDLDISRIWGGTFHHIAHLILRPNSCLLGYGRNFCIIDAEDSIQLINACITEIGIKTRGAKFPKGNVLRDIVSFSLNTGTTVEDVIRTRHPYFCQCLDDVKSVVACYEMRKKTLNVMDFDDLLINARRLLMEHPEVLQRYAGNFFHILVDEYQDTNIVQAQIVDLLASTHLNILAVGDDSQSIYAFRGANFANIANFPERYAGCKVFKLETNYRSTPEILQLANMSIENNYRQYQKNLRSVRDAGVRPIVVPLRDVMQQANFVAQRILELIREGVSINEIAVLYRAHYHSMELQMEIVRRGIPFEIHSGIRFFEQAHIKDATSYLRIAANPYDEVAWKRVLGLYGNIGKATSEKLWQYLSARENPLDAALGDEFGRLVTRRQKEGLEVCRRMLGKIRDSLHVASPPAMIEILLKNGYEDYLQEKYTDAVLRIDDLEQLANYAGKFFTLEDFLGELSLLTNMTETSDSKLDEANGEKIVLSSIHQAKGLEWSVVFMIWCSDGMLPLARSLKDQEGEEEERRLFYVATTRAKDQLYICYPQVIYKKGIGSVNQIPSRFIREVSPSSRHAGQCPYDQWMVDEDSDY